MKIYLRDRNSQLCAEWKCRFDYYINTGDVSVSCGNIFDSGEHMKADAIVSPANSFGYMDGGIDLVYTKYFGQEMQEDLRKCIANYGGEILVGNAVIMGIPNTKNIKYLISAPTMRVPEDVSNTVNAYLSFRAALTVAKDLGLNSILCPGLATTTGKMPVDRVAFQMCCAYEVCCKVSKSDYQFNQHVVFHHTMKTF